jgi:hypothetical protein
MRRNPRASRRRGKFPNCLHPVIGTNGIPHELLVRTYKHELQTSQPRTANVQRAITPLIQHVPSHLQPERIGRTRVSGEAPVPERGPRGAWASGTLRDKETSFCRSSGLGSALGTGRPAEPVNQGPASRRKGEVWGHGPVYSQRKADSIRLFPVSFISARCQRPTSG